MRNSTQFNDGGAVKWVEGDAKEGFEGVLDGPREGIRVAYDVNKSIDDVPLGSDDGSVVVDDEEAVEGGGGGLGGGGGGWVTENVGEGVEEATGGHEGLAAGDGEVEESGGGVLLGD